MPEETGVSADPADSFSYPAPDSHPRADAETRGTTGSGLRSPTTTVSGVVEAEGGDRSPSSRIEVSASDGPHILSTSTRYPISGTSTGYIEKNRRNGPYRNTSDRRIRPPGGYPASPSRRTPAATPS